MSVLGIIDAMRSSYPPAVRLVWQCLENHANEERFWAITDAEIAVELQLGLNTVTRAIGVLVADKIIRVNRCKRRKTVFWMVRTYPARGTNGACPPDELTPQNGDSTAETPPTEPPVDPPKWVVKSELTPQDGDSSAELTPQNGDSVYPPVRIHQKSPPAGRARAPTRRVALPEGWQPSAKLVAFGFDLGLVAEAVAAEADKMRDWAAAKGEACRDWDARFRNWLREEARRRHRERPHQLGVLDQIRTEWNLPSLLTPTFDDEDNPPPPALRLVQ